MRASVGRVLDVCASVFVGLGVGVGVGVGVV